MLFAPSGAQAPDLQHLSCLGSYEHLEEGCSQALYEQAALAAQLNLMQILLRNVCMACLMNSPS